MGSYDGHIGKVPVGQALLQLTSTFFDGSDSHIGQVPVGQVLLTLTLVVTAMFLSARYSHLDTGDGHVG